jgi:hypothetical protein
MRGRRPGKTGGVFAGIRSGFFRAENDADGCGSFAAVEWSMSDRLLGRGSSWRECERVAQAEQDHFQRHVEVEVPRGALLGHLNLTEQVQ